MTWLWLTVLLHSSSHGSCMHPEAHLLSLPYFSSSHSLSGLMYGLKSIRLLAVERNEARKDLLPELKLKNLQSDQAELSRVTRYMSSKLLRIASGHSSVVAVVGKGHLQGIKKNWKQPVVMKDLLTVPSQKPAISTVNILASIGVAVAGVAIMSGIYLANKK